MGEVWTTSWASTRRAGNAKTRPGISTILPSRRWSMEWRRVAGLIAPRPLFAESGTRDPIFPIAASKQSFARVKQVYGVFGAETAVEHEVFEGEHSFYGVRGLPFVARQLRVG